MERLTLTTSPAANVGLQLDRARDERDEARERGLCLSVAQFVDQQVQLLARSHGIRMCGFAA